MNDSDSYSFKTPEVDTIRLIMRIICPLAILSNCGVLYCVAFIKSKQTHLGVLQVYLSIADIVVSISLILGTSILDREALCTVVGVLTNYFLNASSCFSFLVAVYAYLTVLYDMSLADQYWWAYNLYGWCMPFASTVVMFTVQGLVRKGNVIGDSLYFCWISPEYPRLRFVLYYPLL
ncbi:hypothetical protein BCR33DRAFT_257497 [Rhizoclosmatium globosum]|uniref:G-protein coupled receptors family 2 profile 2 domain-containing protein n=1 Tax=Rhizoclosmatium globosum TaxID=329046 RepID=A0A1Y2C8D1_9FUNG|nr:hypothetical protein BCR33DRAFT_257497 [Rhizoclosmatium globosum]|eukprot:ORY43289.1 hypothetical protein BCR33DRAFT_257497 [Rhizoclosmatium globosum]